MLAPPGFEKGTLRRKGSGKRGGKILGVQAGGIGIIILRRLFFHWIGPVPGKLAKGDRFAPSSP